MKKSVCISLVVSLAFAIWNWPLSVSETTLSPTQLLTVRSTLETAEADVTLSSMLGALAHDLRCLKPGMRCHARRRVVCVIAERPKAMRTFLCEVRAKWSDHDYLLDQHALEVGLTAESTPREIVARLVEVHFPVSDRSNVSAQRRRVDNFMKRVLKFRGGH